MRLDRNTNKDREGKYALINLRNIRLSSDTDVHNALKLLDERGMVHWGNESPGDQFFVMKYKDKFTHHALSAYAAAVELESMSPHPTDMTIKNQELKEFADEIRNEAKIARRIGNRIPD